MKKKMQTQAFANLIGALIFSAISVWALIQTTDFQEIKHSFVQPALFPQIMAIGMLVFSLVLMIQSIIKLVKLDENDPLSQPAASLNFVKHKGVLAALIVMALCIFFVATFESLGYVLVSILVSLVVMWLIGKRNIAQMLLVSVLVPLGMWLIFYKVLTVNIPMGPLTFLRDLIDMI